MFISFIYIVNRILKILKRAQIKVFITAVHFHVLNENDVDEQ